MFFLQIVLIKVLTVVLTVVVMMMMMMMIITCLYTVHAVENIIQ